MTINYVAVLPSIYRPWTELCLQTCRLDDLVVVDNTVTNRGVAASWNIGIREMYARDADWLIIISAALRFGEAGGLDMLREIDKHQDALVCQGLGWHFIAFSRRIIDAVGLFDENFYPAYFEDNDYGRRISLWLRRQGDACTYCVHCGTEDVSRHRPGCSDPEGGWIESPSWPRVEVDGVVAGNGHGVRLGGVKDEPQKLLDYYEAKWGGPRGSEVFDLPFGDSNNDLSYWTHI